MGHKSFPDIWALRQLHESQCRRTLTPVVQSGAIPSFCPTCEAADDYCPASQGNQPWRLCPRRLGTFMKSAVSRKKNKQEVVHNRGPRRRSQPQGSDWIRETVDGEECAQQKEQNSVSPDRFSRQRTQSNGAGPGPGNERRRLKTNLRQKGSRAILLFCKRSHGETTSRGSERNSGPWTALPRADKREQR